MNHEILTKIKEEFKNCPDLIIKEIKLDKKDTIYIAYLESVSGSDKVNDYILKNLSHISSEKLKDIEDIQSLIPAPNTIEIKEYDQIEFYITNGFTIVIYGSNIYAL